MGEDNTHNTMPPTKPKPTYLKRCDVVKLCQRSAHLNAEYAVKLLFPPGCAARKVLIPGGKDVYIRAVVLEVLGLTDD